VPVLFLRRKLKNPQGISVAYIVAKRSPRSGEPVVAFLKLKGKGIAGNRERFGCLATQVEL